jgi:hypothetical protein
MEPTYHQLEFDVRVYLTHLELTGERLWAAAVPSESPLAIPQTGACQTSPKPF